MATNRSTNNREPAPNTSGSIEQQLDMCETGKLRGDDLMHRSHQNFHVDMAEENREGDEMSGDEHSSGLQGDEPELRHHPKIDSGVPGNQTEHEEDETERREKRRPA